MGKRFIDTEMFKDTFIRGLEAPLKPLWVYLFCDCNAAGIWNVEMDVAKLRCGINIDYPDDKILAAFESKIMLIANGEKWFIPSFVKIQYNNELRTNNPALKKVIKELDFYGLLTEIDDETFTLKQSPFEAPLKPLLYLKKGSKEEEKEKEKEKEEEKEKEKENKKEKEKVLIMPFTSDNFIHHWQLWKNYRKEMGKKKYQIIGEQSALSSLSKKSDGNENTAVNIINQSMANGWLGFFELKQKNDHGTTTDLLKRTLQRINS